VLLLLLLAQALDKALHYWASTSAGIRNAKGTNTHLQVQHQQQQRRHVGLQD
jgi:hypothetical protein